MSATPEIVEFAAGLALTAALAAGGTIYAAMAPQSSIFGSTLAGVHNPSHGKPQIALTFDDGPNPLWTPQLLDVLARYEIKATFFLIGQFAAGERELVRRTHEAGHLIGNHTWTHPNLALTGSRQTREELTRTSAELEQIIREPVRYFRPPFGMRRPQTLRIARELGLIPVTWNAIGNDWTALTDEQIDSRCAGIVSKNQRRGNATNLVLHDGSHRTSEADRSRSVAASERLIQRFHRSHRFVTLDEWKR
jgi:peptidoglycan/xylan/chitin deacetylase (PgdA/CDA1 family)